MDVESVVHVAAVVKMRSKNQKLCDEELIMYMSVDQANSVNATSTQGIQATAKLITKSPRNWIKSTSFLIDWLTIAWRYWSFYGSQLIGFLFSLLYPIPIFDQVTLTSFDEVRAILQARKLNRLQFQVLPQIKHTKQELWREFRSPRSIHLADSITKFDQANSSEFRWS